MAVKASEADTCRTGSLGNRDTLQPLVYVISGVRESLYEGADVSVAVNLGMTLFFLVACLVVIWWIFRTGYRLKN